MASQLKRHDAPVTNVKRILQTHGGSKSRKRQNGMDVCVKSESNSLAGAHESGVPWYPYLSGTDINNFNTSSTYIDFENVNYGTRLAKQLFGSGLCVASTPKAESRSVRRMSLVGGMSSRTPESIAAPVDASSSVVHTSPNVACEAGFANDRSLVNVD